MQNKTVHTAQSRDRKKINPLSIGSLRPIKPLSAGKATLSTITDKDIAWLWMNLTKAFGYKFIQNFGEKDNGIWLDVLKDLTPDDLAYGFERVLKTITREEREKREAWPPNVKEFRMYCERRLEDFNLPASHTAFAEAKSNSYLSTPYWTHPLVQLASQQLDKKPDYFIGDDDYAVFSKIYGSLCQRFMRGEGMRLLNDSSKDAR